MRLKQRQTNVKTFQKEFKKKEGKIENTLNKKIKKKKISFLTF